MAVQTSLTLGVAGGELTLKRPPSPGARWEIALYRRSQLSGNPLLGGLFLNTAELSPHHFEGRTFATPDEAASAVARLVAM